MDWFKHKVGARTDDAFVPFYQKWKSTGIDVFFGTMELMADNFSVSTPGICLLYKATIQQHLNMRWETIEKVLKDCSKIKNNKGIYVKIENEAVHLNCPYLKELCDEYTRKRLLKLRKKECGPADNVRTLSGQSPTQEERRVEESRIEKTALVPLYTKLGQGYQGLVSKGVPLRTVITNIEDYHKRGGKLNLLEIAINDQSFCRGYKIWDFIKEVEAEAKRPPSIPSHKGYTCNTCKQGKGLIKTGKFVKRDFGKLGGIKDIPETIPCPKCGKDKQ